MHGDDAQGDDRCGRGDLQHGARDAHLLAGPEDHAAEDTCQGVDLLAEDERLLVDEDVAQYAACSAREGAHDDGDPERKARREGLLDADDREEPQSDGVEDEEGVVESDEVAAQHDDDAQCDGRDDEVDAVEHPERGHREHHVAQRTAADGRREAHDVGPEPVETLGRGEPDAADGEGQRPQHLKNKIYAHDSQSVSVG